MTGMLSYQLYSSRNHGPLPATLSMLAAIGYRAVEGHGGLYGDPQGLRRMLDEAGLAMRSGHFGLDLLEGEPERALSVARNLAMEAVFCPWLAEAERPADAAGWRALGRRLEEAGAPFRDAGIAFGWHNHDFEFAALADGAMPIEALFEGGPSLAWEADLAWVARGGADPLAWISRLGDRLAAVHVKDIAPHGANPDEDGWADVGDGVMDWPALWSALQSTPARLFVVEHDNPADDRRFAARSLAAISRF